MKITEARLRANGWTYSSDELFYKDITPQRWLWIDLSVGLIYLATTEGYMIVHTPLPNIRTLEQLSTLFALLGDNPPIDPLDKQARVREAVQAVRVEAMQK